MKRHRISHFIATVFCLLLALAAAIHFSISSSISSSIFSSKGALAGGGLGLTTPDAAAQAEAKAAADHLPLRFEANQGQFDPAVKFLGRGSGVQVFLTATEAVVNMPSANVRMRLAGANNTPQVEGRDLLPGVANYFIGKDSTEWRTGVRTFNQVHYANVYDGVDLLYYGNDGQLEYDFMVAPQADPHQIAFEFAGANLAVDSSGELVIQLGQVEVRWRKPIAYQQINGQQREVAAAFRLGWRGNQKQAEFELGQYDHALPLVIDPVLSYATFLGGSVGDIGEAIALDAAGNIYLAGQTNSANFPLGSPAGNPFQSILGGNNSGFSDVFVTKLSPGGGTIIYSTFIGGSGLETPQGLAIDANGNALITGTTPSLDFPVVNAIQPTKHMNAGNDCFVTKLNATGSALIFSTYFGGQSTVSPAEGHAIAVDASGNAYVAGSTGLSDLLVTPGAFQTARAGINDGSHDGFVTKFNPVGGVIYSTYLGGALDDRINDIAVDSAGNAYLTGITRSSNFPTQTPIQPGLNGNNLSDAFVTKLNAAGSQLIYSTYLGGTGNDQGNGIAIDSSGSAYVTGFTRSMTDFPVVNAFQPTYGGDVTQVFIPADAFVTRLNPAGSAYVYSTYLGGDSVDIGYRIAVDNAGNAYVTGQTSSANIPFPTKNAFQPSINGVGTADAFVTRINTSLSGLNSLIYSSYLGGGGFDYGYAIARDNSGRAYIFGDAQSSDFPTVNPLPGQSTLRGTDDAFLVIVSDVALTPGVQTIATGGSGSLTVTINPAQASAITIPLSSSNPAIASVPPSVTINPNATTATFAVNGVSSGTATITATLPASLGGGSVTATVQVVPLEIALTSGQQQAGSLIAPDPGSGVLGLTQYTIAVPAGATQLKVDLSGNTDVDLYVRFGQRITIQNGQAVADYRSESATGVESVTITPGSTPPLQAGTYYIAVANFGPGASTFVVMATVTGGACQSITVNPATLLNGTMGTGYNQTLTATGGTGAYTFAIGGGALPAGMTLSSTGVLSGTPTVSGTFNFMARATDTLGCIGTRPYALTINPACGTILVNPASLPATTAGTAYNQTITAVGGTAPYSFNVSAGTLPGGLTLTSSGMLSGIPAVPGMANFTIRATDANGCQGMQSYTLAINCQTITVNPATIGPGTAGAAFSQTFTQTGGSGTTTFTISAGALPGGLTLSTAGALTGTPTVFGSFSFTVLATDATGCTGARAYSLTINPPCGSITVNPATLPGGATGIAYNQTLTAMGGTAAYSFTVTAGALPNGLGLSTAGTISGSPSASGTFNFTVKATDANNCFGTRDYSITINGIVAGLQFYPLPSPVRLLDTRITATVGCVKNTGPFTNNETRTLAARTACSTIPANATAVIGNITVVPSGPGFLTLFPSDAAQPTVANSNFKAGEVTNNFFTVGLGAADGAFKIFTNLFNGGTNSEIIIDVTGYYAPPGAGGLYYHALPAPMRLLQTFPGQTGCILNGSQQLQGTNDPNANPALDLVIQGRSPGLPSPCNSIPNDAVVLVGNATTVLPQSPSGFGYLTIYPGDATRPTVASSNYGANDIINGPFAVKLGADGKFKVYTFSTTHLVIDISGYYSASAIDANGAGLLFNPLPKPMRLLETRNIPGFTLTGCYQPKAPIPGGTDGIRTQQAWGACADQPPLSIPATARALVGNVTALNPAGAGFGTFFPGDVGTAPTVATTNYPFPVVFGYNRHYYVGLSPTDGTFKILTQFTSDYVVDVSGYFAP